MTILVRYLMKAVLQSTLLVLLVLLAIAGFVEFVGQLDTVGEGRFGITEALIFSMLRLPLLAAQMIPVAALIGALLGLGQLAAQSELTVMRAAGVSKWRLARAVALSGLLLVVVGGIVGEFLAPPMDQFARSYRSAMKRGGDEPSSPGSIWARDGAVFFNVERVTGELDLGRVYLFEFDGQRRLSRLGYALNGGLDNDDRWVLDNFVETDFSEQGASIASARTSIERYNLNAELLGVSVVRPGSMSLRGLTTYSRYLRSNDLKITAYQTEFWSRIASFAAIVIMPILAIGFVFGSLRSAGTGARMMIGVMIGLGWFLATRLLSNTGQVFELNAVLTAWIPSIALALITVFALSRVR